MTTISRPKTLTAITILLVIIAIVSAVSPFLRTFRTFPANGQMPPQGGNFQGNGSNFQGSQGNFTPPDNGTMPGGNQNFQQRTNSGFNMFSIMRALRLGGQYLIYINYGITLIGVGLALLAAFWVWKQKKRGLNLAIVLAILFLLTALPGLFMGGRGMMNITSVIQSTIGYITIGASLAILVLGILPSVRDSTS